MTAWQIEPLGKRHDRASFDCRIDSLNIYVKRYASQDIKRGMARVYAAAAPDSGAVIGYYSLSAAGFEPEALPAADARNLPPYEQYPALLLGRLAVDKKFQGQGLGGDMLTNVFSKTLRVSETAAVHSLIVEAWDDAAAAFYRQYGFRDFLDEQTQAPRRRMFLPVPVIGRMH